MQVAEQMAKQSWRQRQRAITRKLHDVAVVVLDNADRCFTVVTSSIYFIYVLYIVHPPSHRLSPRSSPLLNPLLLEYSAMYCPPRQRRPATSTKPHPRSDDDAE